MKRNLKFFKKNSKLKKSSDVKLHKAMSFKDKQFSAAKTREKYFQFLIKAINSYKLVKPTPQREENV